MKLLFKSTPNIVSEDMVVSKMGIAEGNGDMLAYFLRDRTYKNKVLACVREIITNAYDEHVKHNIDRSVDVKIEQVNGQYNWSCRDYAKGLNEESIRTVYGMYGGSDKRNNNTQIGGFGIGALSPFASTDSFYVTSYHEGFKTQYACMLSAGDNGISVGEIYKISDPEPTTESGLEVSLDITKKYYEFNRESCKFVKNFLPDANIVYDYNGVITTPDQPLMSIDIDGFVFHQYDDNSYYSSGTAIRMGGVVYQESSSIRANNPKHKILVDVPIGKLSVPISREDLEDTPNNKKVMDEIQQAMDKLYEQDKVKIVTPQFGSVVIGGGYNSTYDGEWFRYSFNSSFPDSWKLKSRISYTNSGFTHNIQNGKYTVYLIPDIKSYNSWLKRLTKFLDTILPNKQILWMFNQHQEIVSTPTLDVSDIIFVDVKKLDLPKLPKDPKQTEYLVYLDGYKKGSYTAEDLDEYVTKTYFKDVDIADGWEKNVDNSPLLRKRVIGLSSDCGIGIHHWVCNSKKMKAQLIELGWLDSQSVEYANRLKEIRDIEKRQEDMQHAQYRAMNALFKIKPSTRTVKAIGKKPNNVHRLDVVKARLMKEDSIRGRILCSLESYNTKLTRQDLRKILTLK